MNIYVGNLPCEITEEQVRRSFRSFGDVESVLVMRGRFSGNRQTRAYSFVGMASRQQGEIAVTSLNGKLICGAIAHVIEALPLSETKKNKSIVVKPSSPPGAPGRADAPLGNR